MPITKINAGHKTVNQHYVPRCYMKNFATVVGKGKKEKALIGFYQFDKGIFRDAVPTKTVCYEEFFYGEDCKIENEFAKKETTWGSTLKKICQCSDWSLLVVEMFLRGYTVETHVSLYYQEYIGYQSY